MTAEVQVENVIAGACEMIRKAPCRQVPCIAVLTEPVDKEDGGQLSPAVRPGALAPHRRGPPPAADDELLHERRSFVPVDGLFEGTAVEDQASIGLVGSGRWCPKLSNDPSLRVASGRLPGQTC